MENDLSKMINDLFDNASEKVGATVQAAVDELKAHVQEQAQPNQVKVVLTFPLTEENFSDKEVKMTIMPQDKANKSVVAAALMMKGAETLAEDMDFDKGEYIQSVMDHAIKKALTMALTNTVKEAVKNVSKE